MACFLFDNNFACTLTIPRNNFSRLWMRFVQHVQAHLQPNTLLKWARRQKNHNWSRSVNNKQYFSHNNSRQKRKKIRVALDGEAWSSTQIQFQFNKILTAQWLTFPSRKILLQFCTSSRIILPWFFSGNRSFVSQKIKTEMLFQKSLLSTLCFVPFLISSLSNQKVVVD